MQSLGRLAAEAEMHNQHIAERDRLIRAAAAQPSAMQVPGAMVPGLGIVVDYLL